MVSTSKVISILQAVKESPSESIESDTIEFKEYSSEKSLHNSKELAEEISALSNNIGGLIIVGVRDSSNIKDNDWESQMVGFEGIDIHTTQERLAGKLRPKLKLDLQEVTFETKNYLVIGIPQRKDTLVSTTSGKVCIREGKSSRPMEPDEITDAVKSLQDYDWSAQVIDKDPDLLLDKDAVKEAYDNFTNRRGAYSSTEANFYEAIGVTVNGNLTKSGLLFLGKSESIRSELGNYEFRFSVKTPSGSLLINDIWHDCLWNTISRAKDHFSEINREIEIEDEGKQYKFPLLDAVAFHEAFLNALVHRDYSIDGMVTVEFSNKQICITSPGTFYGGVNRDNIFSHEPRHRNKALARMLMEYKLVDRAGMGIVRMSLNSLKYGRDFPKFIERGSSVVVSMQAEYFRPPVFVLSQDGGEEFGIPEYLILNSVYQAGYVPVAKLTSRLSRIVDDPWSSIKEAVSKIDQIELCGDKKGIYVRVKNTWNKFFKVKKTFRVYSASENYVKLYDYLIQLQPASNADIKEYLNHKHTTHTSQFLRDVEFVKRAGRGSLSRWSLVNAMS